MAGDQPGWGSLLGMGAVVAASLVVGMALGFLLDSQLDTSPIFVLVGLAVGLVAAVLYVIGEFRKYLGTENGTQHQQ